MPIPRYRRGRGGTGMRENLKAAERGRAKDERRPFLARFDAPGGGQLLEAISLDMLAVGQAYRPDSLLGQVLVDLVEPVAHELLLIVGDPAPVGLARVRRAGVIETVPAGRAADR